MQDKCKGKGNATGFSLSAAKLTPTVEKTTQNVKVLPHAGHQRTFSSKIIKNFRNKLSRYENVVLLHADYYQAHPKTRCARPRVNSCVRFYWPGRNG